MSMSAEIGARMTTAMLVVESRSGPALCLFFSKCDSVLLIDRTGKSRELHHHDGSDAESLCDLILTLNPSALVCGFIGETQKQRLREAGIDIRLGSCSNSIDELFAEFHSLPRA